jgi:hypothetical protein
MPPYRPGLALLAGVLLLAACDFEQVIDLDVPPYQPRLVVASFPQPDSVFTVRVGRSVSALEPIGPWGSGPGEVRDARVVLLAEDGAFLDSLRYVPPGGSTPWEPSGEGSYRSVRGLRPEAGRTYHLEVRAPGYPTAAATTTIPHPVPVEVVSGGSVSVPPYGGWVPRVHVTVADPPGARVYVIEVNERVVGRDRHPLQFSSADPLLRANLETLDDAVDLNIDGRQPDRRTYYGTAYVRNSAFAGGSRTFLLDLHGEALSAPQPSPPNRSVVVTLHTLSADYVRYQQTLALQRRDEGNPFAEPVRLHSNVRGGLGVFAGYASHTVTVPVR